MPIKVTVRRFRRNPLDVNRILRTVFRAQGEFADAIAEHYLDTMRDFSTDHGDHSATPKIVRNDSSGRTINIYVRGGWAAIYRNLDIGFERHVTMPSDYIAKTTPGVLSSRPGGTKGNFRVGRRLLQPRAVVARRFTEQIAELARSGQVIGIDRTLGQYISAQLRLLFQDVGVSKTVGTGRWRLSEKHVRD